MAGVAQPAIRFASTAIADGELLVARLDGVEALSAPFRFELELLSPREDLDLDALLAADARIELDAGGERAALIRHGVLERVERLDGGGRWTRYRASLVPRWWRASLSRRSRLLLDLSVTELAARIFRDAGVPARGLSLRTSHRYPRREYTVQHDESDLALVSRLLEHEGIFHRCDHGAEASVLVIGDDAGMYGRLGAPLAWSPSEESDEDAGDDLDAPARVCAWGSRRAAVAAEASVQERDWRVPARDLRATARVEAAGASGAEYAFGDGHRDGDGAARYARIRAEEIACRAAGGRARTTAAALAPGMVFALRGHPRGEGDWLVTEARHHATQQVARGDGGERRTRYRNELAVLPASTPFRAQRTTPRPRIAGAIRAVVDAGAGAEYAELDEHGRYRVRLPLDLESREPGRASRAVRMAQPYAGSAMGMHFPLHRGTEVLLVHIDGDPDRPVIAGAVPDAETASPVTARNATEGVLRSASGNELRFDDAKGRQRAALRGSRDVLVAAAHDRHDDAGNDHAARVGRDRSDEVVRDRSERVGRDLRVTVERDRSAEVAGDEAVAVRGDAETSIDGKRSEAVGGDAELRVGGALTVDIDGDAAERAGGQRTMAARRIVVDARDELVLRAGKASITLRADGAIVIAGGDVAVRGTGVVTVRAAGDVAIRGTRVVGN